ADIYVAAALGAAWPRNPDPAAELPGHVEHRAAGCMANHDAAGARSHVDVGRLRRDGELGGLPVHPRRDQTTDKRDERRTNHVGPPVHVPSAAHASKETILEP